MAVFGVFAMTISTFVLLCSGQSWWWVGVAGLLFCITGPIVGFVFPRPVLAASRNFEFEIEL